MDVGAWLRSLGMERYEATFPENAVDGHVLLRLTADDLRDLGVSSVGHRRLLLDAVARLHQQPLPQPETLAPLKALSPAEGERRQVAVLFADPAMRFRALEPYWPRVADLDGQLSR